MRMLFGVVVLGTLTLVSPRLAAADPPSAGSSGLSSAEQKFVDTVVPGPYTWRRIADGLFETDSEFAVTRVYTGPQGRKLYLMKLADDLRRLTAVGDFDSKRLGGGTTERGSHLAEVIGELRNERSHSSQGNLKATQTASDAVVACQLSYVLDSEFVAHAVMTDYPEATATSTYSGVFSPPAPGPYTYFRSVSASVDDLGGGVVSDSAMTRSETATISAYAQNIAFGGNCGFETDHVVSITCDGGAIEDFYALNRQQTCSGLLNGDPIQETW